MPLLNLLSNLNMGGGGFIPPAPPAEVVDRTVAQAFVVDYRMPMLRKSRSLARLYEIQKKEARKIRLHRGEGKNYHRDLVILNNNMRAMLLASLF